MLVPFNVEHEFRIPNDCSACMDGWLPQHWTAGGVDQIPFNRFRDPKVSSFPAKILLWITLKWPRLLHRTSLRPLLSWFDDGKCKLCNSTVTQETAKPRHSLEVVLVQAFVVRLFVLCIPRIGVTKQYKELGGRDLPIDLLWGQGRMHKLGCVITTCDNELV